MVVTYSCIIHHYILVRALTCMVSTDVRETVGDRENRDCFNQAVSRRHFLTKSNINNIQVKVNDRMIKRHKDDSMSVTMMVSELKEEPFNPRGMDLSILYFNARSILPKFDELQAVCLTLDPDIICITETWLSSDIEDQEIVLSGYYSCRLDRNRHGGGLVIFYRSTLGYKPVLSGSNDLELSIVSFHKDNCKVCIALFYRPPSSPFCTFDNFCTILHSLDPALLSNFVLLGDFNMDFYNPHHPLYPRLTTLMSTFSLTQVVSQHTHFGPHGRSLIDLVLLSQPSQLQSCSVIPPLGNSDHHGIILSLKWRLLRKSVVSKKRSVWRYKHADFTRACSLLNSVDWDQVLSMNINLSWDTWRDNFMEVMERCIPRATLPERRNLPWLDKSIVQAIKRRNCLYSKQKRTNNPRLTLKYTQLRNQVTAKLRQAKRSYFRRLKNASSRDFWKSLKYLNKKQTTFPELTYRGVVMSTASEKANTFNTFFATCFNQSFPQLTLEYAPDLPPQDCPAEMLCTEVDVFNMLNALDTTKACGPDGITGKMLKMTASSITPVLTKLFNLSIATGTVPTAWKTSTVVPVPKCSANTSDPSNYRPISLLSICDKLLERHISHLLISFLASSCPLSSSQWGFTSKKSTVTALLSVLHDWHRYLEKGIELCAVFFDLRKAFDTVPHYPLLCKLEELGVDRYLLRWICNYLSERKQQVVVDGAISDELSVISGVPQGSVLGPLLFLIYIDGVESVTLSDGTIVLYADDMVLYRPIYSYEDYWLLQQDINAIATWIADNHLQFNTSKCKYMTISRKRAKELPPTINLNGIPLDRVTEFKYLGVLITADLSWTAHINMICTKARRLVGMLYRQFYQDADTTTLKQLYVSNIRPHLEYACQVWDPYLQKDIDMLESVQKFAL